jgi:hypothetical protein
MGRQLASQRHSTHIVRSTTGVRTSRPRMPGRHEKVRRYKIAPVLAVTDKRLPLADSARRCSIAVTRRHVDLV